MCHGRFKALCPEPVEIEADTVAEAISALVKQFPALGRPTFTGTATVKPSAKVVGCDTVESLTQPSEVCDIHLTPAFSGGKSAEAQIIIGGLLIAVGFATGGIGPFALGGVQFGVSAQTLIFAGAGLVLGGLVQMLFPTKVDDQALDETNYLGNASNTVAIGTRIPILMGTHLIFGHFLSSNVSAVEVS